MSPSSLVSMNKLSKENRLAYSSNLELMWMFPGNVGHISTDCTVLYPGR
jgi:hypothetical protein